MVTGLSPVVAIHTHLSTESLNERYPDEAIRIFSEPDEEQKMNTNITFRGVDYNGLSVVIWGHLNRSSSVVGHFPKNKDSPIMTAVYSLLNQIMEPRK